MQQTSKVKNIITTLKLHGEVCKCQFVLHVSHLRTPVNHAFRTKEQGAKRKTQNKYNDLIMVSTDRMWKHEMHKYLLHILTVHCATSLPLLTGID